MATNDDIDEAEELRVLALQSMVRRSKKKIVNNNDTDDQDIKMLRAAALKTITHRNNTQNNKLPNNDDKLVKSPLINVRKRNLPVSTLGNKKMLISNGSKDIKSIEHTYKEKPSGVNNFGHEHIYKLVSNAESQSKSTAVNKDEVKKIVRNGSIQLSNLNSEKIDETMILHITFSSSESDDSSTECDTKKNKIFQNINDGVMKPTVSTTSCEDDHSETEDSLDDNQSKMNCCLKTICGLMRNCESEIEKRNEQVKILLESYEKYQTYSESVRSILHSMKIARDELAIYCSAESSSAEH